MTWVVIVPLPAPTDRTSAWIQLIGLSVVLLCVIFSLFRPRKK